jgi:NitT/TauT family transport system substrate-binding protein
MRPPLLAAIRNRREFLRLAATAATACATGAALAACGGTGSVAPVSAGAATESSSSAGAPAAPAASSAARPNTAARTLNVAYLTTGSPQAALWMADAIGAFKKHNVDVSLRFVTAAVAANAILAKEIDLSLQSATAVITANVNGGTDLVYIGSALNHSQFSLHVAPDIKTAADLKGKSIGTDRPGSTGNYGLKVLLAALGVNAGDVILREIGGLEIVYPALLSGQVQAGALIPPPAFQADAAGFHAIANSYKEPYQNVGPVVLRSRLDELGPMLGPFLEGLRDGIRAFNTQPEMALKVIGQYTKETDQAILQQTYEFSTKASPFQEDLEPTLEGIQNMIDFLGDTVIPKAKDAKAAQFVERRFLDQLSKG